MRILIAEDNEDSRVLLESYLAGKGYEIDSAENGVLAIEMARGNRPDLIISDILMPEMDGYTLCQELKRDEGLCDVPLIFYTATYTDPADEKLALDLGAARFIVKPQPMEDFIKDVEAVLAESGEKELSVVKASHKAEAELDSGHIAILTKKLNKKIEQLELERHRLREVERRHELLESQLQQAQKMEAIGTLAGGIAHDFNNILTPILGYAELSLADLGDNPVVEQNIKSIMVAGQRAKELVKQILTFSRHSGQEKQLLQISSLAKEAIKLLRSSLPVTIDICQDIEHDCGLIMANPTQIHQVIMNLCTNAYQAMQDSGGVLSVEVKRVEISGCELAMSRLKPGNYIKIVVSDTGCGIAEELQQRIFEPYFTTKSQDEGTGLGLSVVHGIISSSGGDIVMSSEAGHGTVFQVFLPEYKRTAVVKPGEALAAPGGHEHILVVDDEVPIASMIKKMLQNMGYTISATSCPEEALGIFTENFKDIDLVITDMTMPKMTGLELGRKISGIKKGVPIILCSGYSDAVDEQGKQGAGISEYIMKPLLKIELTTAIRRVLDCKCS